MLWSLTLSGFTNIAWLSLWFKCKNKILWNKISFIYCRNKTAQYIENKHNYEWKYCIILVIKRNRNQLYKSEIIYKIFYCILRTICI